MCVCVCSYVCLCVFVSAFVQTSSALSCCNPPPTLCTDADKLTFLFKKISNQMVVSCKTYIESGGRNLWDRKIEELMPVIGHCLDLNQQFSGEFDRIQVLLALCPLLSLLWHVAGLCACPRFPLTTCACGVVVVVVCAYAYINVCTYACKYKA